MSIGWRCGLAVLSGVLDALGYIGFGLFPLTWIAKVPVLVATRDATVKQALGLGFLYGIVGHLGGYHWLGETLVRFGGLSRVVSYGILLLITTYFAMLFALLTGVTQHFRRRLGLAPVWSLMVVYPALEFLFPSFLPYNIGASQYRFSAITQIVEITGLLGLTALIGMINGAVHELVEARLEQRRPLVMRWLVPVAGFALVLGYGMIRIGEVDAAMKSARHLKIGLVQTNHTARDRNAGGKGDLEQHRELTRRLIEEHPDVELVVWPETVFVTSTDEFDRLGRRLQNQRPLVSGAFIRDDQGRFFNSMLALNSTGGISGRFDKMRLIPFSETIPMIGIFPGLERYHPRGKVINRGSTYANLSVAGVSAMPMICYEDIMPRFAREMWRQAGPPEVLINISNDSWFGDSHEPLVHLALASFRSIETRRSLIRATSTGISALVDPLGRIIERTGQWKSETLVGEVPVIEDRSGTFYIRHGEVLGWFCLVLTGIGLAGTLRADRRPRAA